MSRAAAGVAALTAAAGCAAYAQLGLRSPPGGGGGAGGGPGGRTHRRGPGNSGGGDVAFSRTRRGALTLDEVHVAYLDAVESAQGHRGVALATVINDAGSRAADEGGADEVFNTPRCAVRSSPGSPKGKKRKVEVELEMPEGYWEKLSSFCEQHGVADPGKAARVVVDWARDRDAGRTSQES